MVLFNAIIDATNEEYRWLRRIGSHNIILQSIHIEDGMTQLRLIPDRVFDIVFASAELAILFQ